MWAAFRRPVYLGEHDPVAVRALNEVAGHRRAAAEEQLQRLELRAVLELDALEHVVDERRRAHRPGAALAVHLLDGLRGTEVLPQHRAPAQDHGGDEAVEEPGGVVERRCHEHDVVRRSLGTLHERPLGEDEVVMREQHRFGLARGAGRGQDAGYVVRRDGGGGIQLAHSARISPRPWAARSASAPPCPRAPQVPASVSGRRCSKSGSRSRPSPLWWGR